MRRLLASLLLLAAFIITANVKAQNRRLAMDYVNRGTKELDAGDLAAALSLFNRAIELDLNYGAAYFSRGLVRKRQADLEGAISDFTRSIDLKPMAEAYLDRGATRKDKGDRAIEIGPANARAGGNARS